MEIFADKTAGTIMVAHNAPFDAAFIEKAFFDTGVKSRMHHYHKLDTISIAYAKLHDSANIEKFTLHELCEHFGIENKNEHSALSDARACFELYKKLMLL